MAPSAFKFLKKEHAESLLIRGNIYIPSMRIFANKAVFNGYIYDNEGYVKVTNKYTKIKVGDVNNFGVIGIPKHQTEYRNFTFENSTFFGVFSSDDGNIYCTTSHFFSESLQFAVSEDKDSCIFITDIDVKSDDIGSSSLLVKVS